LDFDGTSPEAFEGNVRLNDLFIKAKAGCNASLGELLNEFRPFLLQIANDQMPSQFRCKLGGSDIVQQSFMNASRSFDQFHGKSPNELTNWLARIVVNNVLSARRHFRSEKRNAEQEIRMTLNGSTAAGQLDIPCEGSSPSKRMISEERRLHIAKGLSKLSEDYRRVILMRHQDGLSFSEMGMALQRSADATRKLWARAAEALANELRSMGVA
jgi:RNA polymerase sigma-70 factor (ECF subfamily)